MRRFDSFRNRLMLGLAGMQGQRGADHAGLTQWPLPQLLALAGKAAPAPGTAVAMLWTAALLLPLAWPLAAWLTTPLARLLRALEGAVLSYRDGEFGSSIAADAPGATEDMRTLLRLHADLGQALREQRQHLAQRELLLDTVIQHTPVALLLSDAAERVVFANVAARQLLADGRSLAGAELMALLEAAPAALREAMLAGADGLFSIEIDGAEERFHLSQRQFRLQGRPHRLRLLRRMTRELSRQEVAAWKRVIRVISHELNNSLAPISSLAHTGAELARRGQIERLPQVFASLASRAAHLHGFLSGYAQFAKLPVPKLAAVEWPGFVERLGAHFHFALAAELPPQAGHFDAAQIEQALINLLKNAHEAGGPHDAVQLLIAQQGQEWRLTVCDRGPGMNEAVLAQALLPFYSTKRSGSGLGLALTREIVEAHGGRITLANREGGGLSVTLALPRSQPAPG